jgi:hypothetical protein
VSAVLAMSVQAQGLADVAEALDAWQRRPRHEIAAWEARERLRYVALKLGVTLPCPELERVVHQVLASRRP